MSLFQASDNLLFKIVNANTFVSFLIVLGPVALIQVKIFFILSLVAPCSVTLRSKRSEARVRHELFDLDPSALEVRNRLPLRVLVSVVLLCPYEILNAARAIAAFAFGEVVAQAPTIGYFLLLFEFPEDSVRVGFSASHTLDL